LPATSTVTSSAPPHASGIDTGQPRRLLGLPGARICSWMPLPRTSGEAPSAPAGGTPQRERHVPAAGRATRLATRRCTGHWRRSNTATTVGSARVPA
jgi:hypothetical protein